VDLSHAADPARTTGENVLLSDDLFRSGATMNAITAVLMSKAKAGGVGAFTITRTRSDQ
jgi:predicted amidophosphoribosyltransferase